MCLSNQHWFSADNKDQINLEHCKLFTHAFSILREILSKSCWKRFSFWKLFVITSVTSILLSWQDFLFFALFEESSINILYINILFTFLDKSCSEIYLEWREVANLAKISCMLKKDGFQYAVVDRYHVIIHLLVLKNGSNRFL